MSKPSSLDELTQVIARAIAEAIHGLDLLYLLTRIVQKERAAAQVNMPGPLTDLIGALQEELEYRRATTQQ